MAANTPNTSKTQTKVLLTKKQAKALERSSASSSAPWNKPSLSELQIIQSEKLSNSCQLSNRLPNTKPDIKPLQTLTECLQLLHTLAEEVNNISREKSGSNKAIPEGDAQEPGSLESSRTLILQWAEELKLNMVKKEVSSTEKARRSDDLLKKDTAELEKHNKRLQQWAVELKNITEAHGVCDDELRKLLFPKGPKESRLTTILPLLEFVAWTLLSQDNEEAVSMLWLPTKQRAWGKRSGSPRYIPNSVSVKLDASSSHLSLAVSPDRLQVREAAVCSAAPSNNNQHFAEWPCVLGDIRITAGRQYWEVQVSPNGNWRIGVVSEIANWEKKSTMSPRTGHWTLWKGSSLWACTEKPIKLARAALPRQIGVHVDVREGQVSFYDVERRVHIYTFSDTFSHGLMPLFGCLDGDTVLKITPARVVKF